MPALTRPIGLHLQTRGGLLPAAARALEIGVTAVQLFADNPSRWRRREAPPRDASAFVERLRAGGVTATAVHGPYLLNLASADETIRRRSIETIAHELRVAPAYGAFGVNVHIGSHVGSGLESGLRRIGEGAREALALADAAREADGSAPLLVLENSAGGGDGIGGTVEELAAVLGAIARAGADTGRVAFCLDTSHLWGAGHDIRTPRGLEDVLERFDRLLGLDRLVLVHLNDSRASLGSHLDRHAHVGSGEIGVAGMATVLAEPRLERVPMVVETDPEHGFDALNQERIRLLLAGARDLPPLPDQPRTSRRSRAAIARKRGGAARSPAPTVHDPVPPGYRAAPRSNR